jgi:hypothetical protein
VGLKSAIYAFFISSALAQEIGWLTLSSGATQSLPSRLNRQQVRFSQQLYTATVTLQIKKSEEDLPAPIRWLNMTIQVA